MKKIVLVDMDGVLCDFDRHVYENIPTNDFEFHLRKEPRIADNYNKKMKHRVIKFYSSEGFFRNLSPIEGERNSPNSNLVKVLFKLCAR
jgi:hypothetical protein